MSKEHVLQLTAIACGGALGALSRYGVSSWAFHQFGNAFPYGTLIVNVVGCFLLGVLSQVSTHSSPLPYAVRAALTVGFLGALTTFSTFGYETFAQLEQRQPGMALLNVGANLALGLLTVWLGILLIRLLIPPPV